ncbi:MAG: acyltransferase [Deltaproteobacteria bacterium]|nr:acyltransferase [Deltaproteobacteria bacterium]
MKVGFIQSSPKFGEVQANVDDALKRLSTLAKKGARLVVLPELFNTGYQFKNKREAAELAEPLTPKGYTTARLMEAARDHKLHIVAGLVEVSRGKVYNSSVLVGPKGVIGVYRKAHLFYNEKKIFSKGNTPFKVYDIGGIKGGLKIGMMICFDWLFPEVTRRLALLGADIICHPSNLVLPNCPEAMITRALENRVFTITANRIGTEARIKGSRLKFIGKSEIVSPMGALLCRASGSRAETRLASVDTKDSRDKKITPFNDVFKDRRIELYS